MPTGYDAERGAARAPNVTSPWPVLDRAMEAMMQAAESGGRNEIREATRLIAFVLRQWSLL